MFFGRNIDRFRSVGRVATENNRNPTTMIDRFLTETSQSTGRDFEGFGGHVLAITKVPNRLGKWLGFVFSFSHRKLRPFLRGFHADRYVSRCYR